MEDEEKKYYVKTYDTKEEAVNDTEVYSPHTSYCRENKQVLFSSYGLKKNTKLKIKQLSTDPSAKDLYVVVEEAPVEPESNEIWYKTSDNLIYDFQSIIDNVYPMFDVIYFGPEIESNYFDEEIGWWRLKFKSDIDKLGLIYIPEEEIFEGYVTFMYQVQDGELVFCKVSDVKFSSKITKLDRYSFTYCEHLEKLTITRNIAQLSLNEKTEERFYAVGPIYEEELINPLLNEVIVDSSNTVYDSRNNCNAIIETATNKLVFGCKNTVIPDTVTEIGVSAFYYCKGLTSIVVPENITSIGNSAFSYCSNLESIISYSETPPQISGPVSTSKVFYKVNKNIPVYVPEGSVDLYKAAPGWNYFYNSIQPISEKPEVNEIWYTTEDSEIYDLQTSIETLSSLTQRTYKGPNILSNEYSNLTKCFIIEFDGPVTTLGNNGSDIYPYFSWDNNLPQCKVVNITLPDGITTIYNGSFGSSTLKSINIPQSVTSIGNMSYIIGDGINNCLESIKVDSSNTVYDSRNNCNAIIETATNKLILGCKNTVIPSDILTVGDYAFTRCELSLGKHFSIPEGIKYIGNYSFDSIDCTSVCFPSSLISVGSWNFNHDMQYIESKADVPPVLGEHCFAYVDRSIPVYVYNETVIDDYKSAPIWEEFNILPIETHES